MENIENVDNRIETETVNSSEHSETENTSASSSDFKEKNASGNFSDFTETKNTSTSSSDWTKKLFFDRSFSAKLILADDKTKEYYASIASELLKYDKVKSKTSWNGVSFVAGRSRIAYLSITGKTLCLYLSVDPDLYSDGKYKVKNVGDVKNKAKTPSMLKIKSDGAKRRALSLITVAADNYGLTFSGGDKDYVDPSNFKTDSFNNLITRGLVRILRKKTVTSSPAVEDLADKNFDEETEEVAVTSEKPGVYEDTVKTIDALVSRHGVYNEILESFAEGLGKIGLTRKKILRSVDEIWVKAVEDCIPSLDELIRNPNHFIAETEEVLPIELTKKISGRSITHLGRHTDYLTRDDDGDITPMKMLNVFRDDSVLTYENKFLNTLIARLYSFVSKRCKTAREYGADEVIDCFDFENSFNFGPGKGRIRISVEYSERNLDKDVKNVLSGTGLWARVERLNDIVAGYLNSPFVKSMDKNYVHPPILRTNAIIKNKYFRECLALWEFIESYDDAGYGIVASETVKIVSDEYVRQTYADAAALYLEFRYNARNEEFEETTQKEYKPVYKPENADFDDYEEVFTEDGIEKVSSDDTDFALRVALLADVEENETELKPSTTLRKTFHAKIRLADESLKENFAEISNEFLKYKKVKMRQSKRFASYTFGRNVLARAIAGEKSIKLYFALPFTNAENKYNLKQADKAGFDDTPSMLTVRSRRSLKYAKELISVMAEKFSLVLSKKETTLIRASDYAYMPIADMIEKGWVKVRANPRFVSEDVVSFGPTRKEITAINAERVEKQAVPETRAPLEKVSVDDLHVYNVGSKRSLTERLSKMVVPDANYSKPTEYGIDDASGFLKDEQIDEKSDES